jgi:hypothetical protein
MGMKSRGSVGRKPWFDPRFAIGLVLIAASVVGTVFVVSAADSTVEILAARTVLTPGQTVTASDLVARRVTLDQAGALYLRASDVDPEGVVITRTVAAGELVPASAVGRAASLDSTAVVVAIEGELPESVQAGAVVDLWASVQSEEGEYGPPAVIVTGATVARLVQREGIVVGESGSSVELLVPRETVARLLQATANGAALSLVPVAIPAGD